MLEAEAGKQPVLVVQAPDTQPKEKRREEQSEQSVLKEDSLLSTTLLRRVNTTRIDLYQSRIVYYSRASEPPASSFRSLIAPYPAPLTAFLFAPSSCSNSTFLLNVPTCDSSSLVAEAIRHLQ
jgi:hypothetical protein